MNKLTKTLFTLFMLVVYFGMGYLLLFTHLFAVPGAIRIALGLLLALYGLFRAVRLWKELKGQ